MALSKSYPTCCCYHVSQCCTWQHFQIDHASQSINPPPVTILPLSKQSSLVRKLRDSQDFSPSFELKDRRLTGPVLISKMNRSHQLTQVPIKTEEILQTHYQSLNQCKNPVAQSILIKTHEMLHIFLPRIASQVHHQNRQTLHMIQLL